MYGEYTITGRDPSSLAFQDICYDTAISWSVFNSKGRCDQIEYRVDLVELVNSNISTCIILVAAASTNAQQLPALFCHAPKCIIHALEVTSLKCSNWVPKECVDYLAGQWKTGLSTVESGQGEKGQSPAKSGQEEKGQTPAKSGQEAKGQSSEEKRGTPRRQSPRIRELTALQNAKFTEPNDMVQLDDNTKVHSFNNMHNSCWIIQGMSTAQCLVTCLLACLLT